MENVKIIKDEYTNIQGVGVKKIKVTNDNFNTLLDTAKEAVSEVIDNNDIEKDVKEFNMEPVKDEEPTLVAPSFAYNSEPKTPSYELNEEEIKERIAVNYGNFTKPEKKEEKKEVKEITERAKVTEKEFEQLLNTDVVIMQDQMDKFREVYKERKSEINDLKQQQIKLADAFQKVSNEEQSAKADYETKKKRTAEMKNQGNFAFLEIGKNEDERIIAAIKNVDESLRNLLNVNLVSQNEANAKIEKCKSDKKEINKREEEVRNQIGIQVEKLNKFMENNISIIKDTIKISENYKNVSEESEKAINDEWQYLPKEPKVEETVSQPSEPVVAEETPNIFESFRQNEVFRQQNTNNMNPYMENVNFENQTYGRAA